MNILTFDIEEWYLEKVLHGGRGFRYRQFDEMLAKVLDELDESGIKATFFCVGRLATDFPDVLKRIAVSGHEIGCHSNEHTWLDKMTEEGLRRDTTEALKALEDVCGESVVSYRAPAFSITEANKWAVEVLAGCGIESDASVFPAERDYGGYAGFPLDTPCIIGQGAASLKEYPVGLTTIVGKRTAYSGGGYFRLFPYRFISRVIRDRDYNICYFHLNDLIDEEIAFKSRAEYEEYFKEPGTLKNRLVRYVKSNIGTGNTFGKMMKLLGDHSFVSIREADQMIDWDNSQRIYL